MTTQVQSEMLRDAAVTTAKIADANVTTAKIADSNVTTAKIANNAVTPAKLAQALTRGAIVTTTSGTSVDITGIPSWVNRITVAVNGVSKNGSGSLLFQLGTTSGIETTGYGSACTNFVGNVTSNAGFIVADGNAAYTTYGHLVLTHNGSNGWVGSFVGSIASTLFFLGSGAKSLAGVLDRIRITTSTGTDVFDAGSVNILYE